MAHGAASGPLAMGLEDARALERQARRVDTPCGDGRMVWRGWGEGARAVLLLHGGAGAWTHWIRNIETLRQHYTVWAPDFPGMGDSSLPPEPWTPQSIADITQAGLQIVIGDSPCDVVGFSFGGMIGGFLAARQPQRVRSLVIVAAAGTGLAHDPGHLMQPWRRVADAGERREIHRSNLTVWMLHDPAQANALAVDVAAASVEADRLRNREVSRTDALLQVLPQVACPVHGIWGREDVMYARTREQLDAALRDAGIASMRFLDGAGHWAPFEKPVEFNAALLGILGRG